MLQELVGKTVTIHLGILTESIKGEVVEIKDSWLKLTTKRKTELINIEKVIKISVLSK